MFWSQPETATLHTQKTHLQTRRPYEGFSLLIGAYICEKKALFFSHSLFGEEENSKCWPHLASGKRAANSQSQIKKALTKTLKTETIKIVRKGQKKDCHDMLSQLAKTVLRYQRCKNRLVQLLSFLKGEGHCSQASSDWVSWRFHWLVDKLAGEWPVD